VTALQVTGVDGLRVDSESPKAQRVNEYIEYMCSQSPIELDWNDLPGE